VNRNRVLPSRLQPLHSKPAVEAIQAAADIDPAVKRDGPAGSIAADMLYGAEEIQEFLGLRNPKQVYYLVEKGEAPIKKVPGFKGLVASKTALTAWLRQYVPGLAV